MRLWSLRKDPKRRIQHIGDVRLELEEVADTPEDLQRAPRTPYRNWLSVTAMMFIAASAGFLGLDDGATCGAGASQALYGSGTLGSLYD